jgi:RND superfamily putative drug exporter
MWGHRTRSMTESSLYACWARFVARRPWWILAMSALLAVASGVLIGRGGSLSSNFPPQGEAQRAADLIAAELPQPGRSVIYLVFTSRSLTAHDARFEADVSDALQPLRSDPRVTEVATPYDPTRTAQTLVSGDGHSALALVYLRDGFNEASGYYRELRSRIHPGLLQVQATGALSVSHDLDAALANDLDRGELVSLPVALGLLILVFGTLLAATLPLATAILCVLGGSAGVLLLSSTTSVSDFAIDLVVLLGLGLSIDYSYFILSRFREELAAGRATPDALAVSLATAGRAVTFSGMAVVVGFGGLLFYRGTFLPSLGVASLVVALAVTYGLTVLPAMLAILGPNVNRLRVRRWSSRIRRSLWPAIVHSVLRRPILALASAVGVLVIVGSPFLAIRFESSDVNFLPADAESRQAHDRLVSDFPLYSGAHIAVVAYFRDGQPLTQTRVGELYDLSRSIAAQPEVGTVESIVDLDPALTRADYQALYASGAAGAPRDLLRETVGRHIVVLQVAARHTSESDAARRLVRTIRSTSLTGGQVLVTGQTAFDLDMVDLIRDKTPAALAFVFGATCLLLFLHLRSVVLPIKAVLMTLMSITASFGALVWIFQQGHLHETLGFVPSGLDPALLVFLFYTVFGLSMDYEILLLSRVREAYDAGLPNEQAVAIGLRRSAPVITGAAAIMIAVFASFATGQVVLLKALNIGLALGILADATIVRVAAVPALMRLLGDLNWWAPGGLNRRRASVVAADDSPPVGAESPSANPQTKTLVC